MNVPVNKKILLNWKGKEKPSLEREQNAVNKQGVQNLKYERKSKNTD